VVACKGVVRVQFFLLSCTLLPCIFTLFVGLDFFLIYECLLRSNLSKRSKKH